MKEVKLKLDRYKQNLAITDSKVYSYKTHVANINHSDKTIERLGWWSATTSKHINYVAKVYGYKVVDCE